MVFDLFKLLIPLSKQRRKKLQEASFYLDDEDAKQLKLIYKLGNVNINYKRFGVSGKLMDDVFYPEIIINLKKNDDLKKLAEKLNSIIYDRFQLKAFKRFSKEAGRRIPEIIAPNIYGLKHVKMAVSLQLFCPEIIHILLLGDPGTGKTKIIKSASELHSLSVFGLGSGISGAGLGLTVKGDKVIKGLLPRADQGICCIDELNLIKKNEYGYLYSAMEDGFVSYDKANKHVRENARIRVLATANPTGDKFVGRILETLKKQIPFKQALLSRFHLIYIVRKLDVEGFVRVAKKIVSNEDKSISLEDKEFVKKYIDYCEKMEIKFPPELQKEILNFAEKLKKKESKYLFEITPRAIVGLVRLCKARARIEMRKYVNIEDIKEITNLIEESFKIRK